MVVFTEPGFNAIVDGTHKAKKFTKRLSEEVVLVLEKYDGHAGEHYNIGIYKRKKLMCDVNYRADKDCATTIWISSYLCERTTAEAASKTFLMSALQQHIPEAFEWFLWNKL